MIQSHPLKKICVGGLNHKFMNASFDPSRSKCFAVARVFYTIRLERLIGKLGYSSLNCRFLGLWQRMKAILIFGFLAIGSEQLSAQALPSYDNSYWDGPECIKVVMNVTSEIDTEKKAQAVCNFAKSLDENAHNGLVAIWDSIPSGIRSKCIADQVTYRKAHNSKVGTESYSVLAVCIDEQIKR